MTITRTALTASLLLAAAAPVLCASTTSAERAPAQVSTSPRYATEVSASCLLRPTRGQNDANVVVATQVDLTPAATPAARSCLVVVRAHTADV